MKIYVNSFSGAVLDNKIYKFIKTDAIGNFTLTVINRTKHISGELNTFD
jgi:hypothetical protein